MAMDAFTKYLEKSGRNFLVSSMAPSLAFIVASLLVIDPPLSFLIAFKLLNRTIQLIIPGSILIILTIIIWFMLAALNTFILKMFEGYVIPPENCFFFSYASAFFPVHCNLYISFDLCSIR
jgi:hypothetical protein